MTIKVEYIPNTRIFATAPDVRWIDHDFKLVRYFLIDITDIPY